MADTTLQDAQERVWLDRIEELAREAAQGYVVWPNAHQIADGITDESAASLMEVMTPAVVLQLISMARRAPSDTPRGIPQTIKPEDEWQTETLVPINVIWNAVTELAERFGDEPHHLSTVPDLLVDSFSAIDDHYKTMCK